MSAWHLVGPVELRKEGRTRGQRQERRVERMKEEMEGRYLENNFSFMNNEKSYRPGCKSFGETIVNGID
jgi:hypothetical protein